VSDLTGRTVLITGASSGIGKDSARALVLAGAHVAAQYCSNRAGAAEAVAGTRDDRTLLLRADFRGPDAATTMWEAAVGWRGGIDVVVCNAAVMPQAALDEPDAQWDASWDEALQVNVVQQARLIRHAVAHFADRGGGVLIVLSSWVAHRGAGNPRLGAYAASKAAIATLAKTVARHYARQGVLVFTIAPGVVRTEMSYQSAESQGGAEAVTAGLAMGEWVPASDIADLITYLAGGTCRHLTGATLDVNGATYMR
jgi:3-oxoacyl-[acyl-carrier protein] reductase